MSTLDWARVAPMTPPDFECVSVPTPEAGNAAPLKVWRLHNNGLVPVCATHVCQANRVSLNVPATCPASSALESEVDKLLHMLAADNSA